MENVVKYFQEEIESVERWIKYLTEDKRHDIEDYPWVYGKDDLRLNNQEIESCKLTVVNLQKLLEEALNAQRLLDTSKRQ